ncbi:MAG TPA: CopG family transcriptional regulator [Burkholderiales bacterium]|nr:CopG family transcriptional regulator [Burkholderiales bacterium]
MKRTDLEKLKGRKIAGKMNEAPTPGRYGSDNDAAGMGRRERRKLDQARGLVPFAVKLDADLVKRVRELATERGVAIDALIDDLLRKSLER